MGQARILLVAGMNFLHGVSKGGHCLAEERGDGVWILYI